MRYQAGHKAKTRDSIIREAAAAVRTVGPRDVGVADVMGKLGLTHGGFYAHFRNKEELIAAAITHMFDDQIESRYSPLNGSEPDGALNAIVESYLSPLHRSSLESGCPLPALASEMPRLPAAMQAAFSAGSERVVDEIARHLKRKGTERSKAVARSALAEMVGAVAMSRTIGEDRTAARFLKDARSSLSHRLDLVKP